MGVVTATVAALAAPSAATTTRQRFAAVVPAVALVVLAACLAFAAAHHEPWFDEAQAWLIARESTLVDLLESRVRYEGTPGLWHLLLWCLTRAGLPFAGMPFVSAALAVVGAAILLTRAPFPVWLRAGFAFSYFFAFQYAVVARSYALDLVLVPLAAALFSGRSRRPLAYAAVLGLLANCNAHSFILAGCLAAEWGWRALAEGTWRRGAILAAAVVYGALAVAAVAQAWPPADVSFNAGPSVDDPLGRPLVQLTEAFVDRIDVFGAGAPDRLSRIIGAALSLVLLAQTLPLMRRAGHLPLFGAVVAACLVFSTLKFANLWHAGLLVLAWLFCLWVSWDALDALDRSARRRLVVALGCFVFLHGSYTLAAWRREVAQPYSAGQGAANVLRESGIGPDTGVAALGFKSFALQPWWSANLFANYHGGTARPAHYRWTRDEDFPIEPDPRSWDRIVRDPTYTHLVLSPFRLDAENRRRFVDAARAEGHCLLAAVPGGLIWKTYVLEADDLLLFGPCDGGRLR